MAIREQEPPFTIQIEPTQGCNLQCSFCGINGIQKKPGKYKFMTTDVAMAVAMNIWTSGWNPRIEFAMHGEPTMNPKLKEIIWIFREVLPKHQLMMLTNGGGLLKGGVLKNIDELFAAGINIIGFDAYEMVNIKNKVTNAVMNPIVDLNFDVHFYPSSRMSPHSRYGHKAKKLIIIEDIEQAIAGNHATLNNHCGHGAPLDNSAAGKKCAKPFREMSIRWDGKIALCCNSFEGRYFCGDAMSDYITDIWNNKLFHVARKHLYHGMRDFLPCKGCNALSYRVGLLPDKFGKETMAKPTLPDKRVAAEAGNARPLTVEVKEVLWK